MSSYNWLVRRDLEKLNLRHTEFDGEKLVIRLGKQVLVVEGENLKVEVKGAK